MTFGQRLAAARRRANITQENFARVLGVSRQAVSKWESDLTMPETEKLARIAQVLEISLDELMGVAPERQASPSEPPRESKPRTITLHLGMAFEHKSTRTVRGVPLLHIHVGLGKKARGIIAIGNNAEGLVALGLLAKGILSFGLLSIGLFSFGLLALGLLAFGTLAVGIFAAGAIALGVFAVGAIAVGLYSAGALAVGLYGALGDHAYSHLGVAVGKSLAKGALPLSPKESFTTTAIQSLIDRVRASAPPLLRPAAAVFVKFLSFLIS